MSDELKENIKNTNVWVRLVFMVIFAMLYWVAEIVLAMVVAFQFLCVLFTGKKNAKVLELGAQLSTYAYQIFRFLTYNSEVQPFPMSDWPSGAELQEGKGEPSSAAAKRPASRAATTKKPAKQVASESGSETAKTEEADKPEA